MTPELSLLAGAIGCLMGTVSVVLGRRYRAESEEMVQTIRGESAMREADALQRLEALAKQIANLQVLSESTAAIPPGEKLNRSGRAQALQILRTGVSADTAAERLGMARREVRLLARVSQALSVYR